jgi:hypothetical protein
MCSHQGYGMDNTFKPIQAGKIEIDFSPHKKVQPSGVWHGHVDYIAILVNYEKCIHYDEVKNVRGQPFLCWQTVSGPWTLLHQNY